MVECFLEVFMDDFSVFGSFFEKCLHHLSLFLEMCKENSGVELGKYHFMVKKGIVLGRVISDKRIGADKAKVNLIFNLTSPRTVKEIRSFLGHDGFYRRFIKELSKISRSFCNLLAKDVAFVFNNECLKAFGQLKAMLTSAFIIQPPN